MSLSCPTPREGWTHLSLFSGIGGIDLAAHWAGFRTVAFVERDEFCQKVLAKNFPGIPIYGDIAQFQYPPDRAAPWLMSAGFPCQPFSDAGKREGTRDARFLWDEVLRLLKEARPVWFLGENVTGLLTIDSGITFGAILRTLGEVGYRVGWAVYGACEVGAPHERERVFIVANAEGERRAADVSHETGGAAQGASEAQEDWGVIRTAFTGDREAFKRWGIDRPTWFLRGHDGVPPGLDEFRALGNAVVPQQVYPILKAIASSIQRECAA